MTARSGIVVAGVGVSAACMWLASRNVQWSALGGSLRTIQIAPLLVAVVATVAAYAVMACRWRVLLGASARIPLHDVFDALMIGFFSGLVIPQRLGDLVKVGLLARKARASVTAVVATVVVERLSDVVMLLVVAAVLASVVPLPFFLERALWLVAVAAAGAIVALWCAPAIWRAAVGRVPSMRYSRIGAFLDRSVPKFARGLEAAHHGPSLGRALSLAALVWLLSGLAMSAYIEAFGLAVPWYAGFLVILLTNLAGVLPSSPGGVGVYHYMTVIALTVWSADQTSALAFAFVTHAIAMLVILVVGGASLLRQGLTLQTVRDQVGRTASAVGAVP